MSRSRRASAVAAAVVCVGALVAVVLLAVLAEGREGTESSTNDGGAWLINRRVGSIGHVNRHVEELSAAVRVSQPGAVFEVFQPNDGLIVLDRSANTLQMVDERTHLVLNTVSLPPDAEVREFDEGVAIAAPAPFRIWSMSQSELLSVQTLDSFDPVYQSTQAATWAVSRRGMVAADDPTERALVLVEAGLEPKRVARQGTIDEVLFDGDRVVVKTGNTLAVVNGDDLQERATEIDAWSASQLPTAVNSGSVVVATSTGTVLRLDTENGSTTSLGSLPGTEPAPLIDHEGCVYVVMNEPGALWIRCGSAEPRVSPLQTSPGSVLRLRLVNGWVWVNDLTTGNLWLVTDDLELNRIDDWGAVLPQEADPEDREISAADSADDIVEEVENPDAEDALTIDADQFDEDGVNQPPVAFSDDGVETHRGRPVVIDVIANDEDPDNDVLLVSSVQNLSEGDAVVAAAVDGTRIQVSPAPGFEGVIRYSYTITDGRGGSDSALGTVVVQARTGSDNRPPVAQTDVGSVTSGERLIINVLANDSDPDGDSLVLLDAQGTDGSLSFDPSGQLVFEPESVTEEGEIELTYRVADDFGEITEGRVRVTVRLEDSNQPPDARNDGGATVVAQPIRLNLLANDTDPDGDDLFVAQRPELLSPPNTEVFTTITADGEFVFIPERAGTFLFSYGASDDGGATDLAQIRVEVAELSGNSPPVPLRDDVVIPAGESRIVYALENDGDPDGDIVGIVDFTVTPGSGLRVERFADIGFRVFVDLEGPVRRSFTYAISDGESEPVETVVMVAVAEPTSANQPPVAQVDAVEVRPGRSVLVPVLDNDFDPEGGPLRVVAVSEPRGATAQIAAANQSVRIDVAASTTTSFSVNYDVVDEAGNRTASTIRVRVVPEGEANRPPIARPDSARTPFETDLAVPVVANDSDPDGDAIRVEAVTAQPLNGTAEIDPVSGRVIYTPFDGFSGTDRFRYSIVDALGASSEGEVLVGVMPEPRPNRDPVAIDDSFITVAAGGSLDLDVLTNDSDPDGDQLRVSGFGEPEVGSLERTIDGRFLLYRAPVEQAEDRTINFDYEISDGAGGSATATVTVLVQATPPRPEGAPVAVDDSIGPVTTGSEVRVEVVGNDSDPNGPVSDLAVSVFDAELRVEGQTVVFDAPELDAEYSYRITDRDGLQDTGVITVTVVNPQPPVAIDDQFGPVARGDVVEVEVLANDYDLDGEPEDLDIVGVVGADAQVGDRVVRITAPAESAQYEYTIADADGLEATATISLIVVENRGPVVDPVEVSTRFQEAIEIDLSGAATDPDGDPLFYACCDSARNGSPNVLEAGEGRLVVEFQPDEGFSGDAFFAFGVDDQFGNVVAGSVTVFVEEQPNRPPETQDTTATIQAPRLDGPPVSVSVDLGAVTLDPDDDPLGFAVVEGPGANLSANVTDSFVEITATDQAEPGTTELVFEAVDPEGEGSRSTVVITIEEPQNEPPQVSLATVAVPAGNSTTADLAATTVDNDADEILTYDIGASTDERITITLTGQSTVTVAGTVNASGRSETVQYTVTDRMGEQAVGEFTVDVGDPDQPLPQASADSARTLQEQPVTIDVLSNDTDPIGQGLTIIDPGSPTNGTVSVEGGTITYTPGVAFFGDATFSYTIGDAAEIDSRQSTAQVTVEVVGRPDPPAAPACTPESTQVQLTWTEPPNNGASVEGYDLEQVNDQGVYVEIPSRTNHTWSDLDNGTEYRFRLAARNEAGLGQFSDWSLPCTPDIEPERPAPPQVVHGNGFLRVSWTEPVNNGSEIERYELRIGEGTTVPIESGLEYQWDGLENGLDYTFQVAARNAKGLSDFSTPSTPEHPSTVPVAPVIQATTRAGLLGANASGILQVNWTAVPTSQDGGDTITHYLVEVRPGSGTRPEALGANTNSYIWSGLSNGVDHEFRVVAVNRDGESAPSAWSPALAACTIPGTPLNVTATAGDRQVFVDFSQPADNGGCGITEYEVRRLGGSGGSTFVGHPTTEATMTGLDNGTSVAFEVRASNVLGSSSWVATSSVIPKGAPICPESYRVTEIDPTGTTFVWDAANFNGGTNNSYERRGSSGEWRNQGNVTTETMSAWGEGTHTLELRAVNEIGTDDCGSVTFTTCPAAPPAPNTPSITADQTANTITLHSFSSPTPGCQSQSQVTSAFAINEYYVELDNGSASSAFMYRPLDGSAGVDFLSPGTLRGRIQGCYPGRVCGAWSAWSATAEIFTVGEITIFVSGRDFVSGSEGQPGAPVHCHDAPSIIADGGDPNQGCYYVRMNVSGFSSPVTIRCFGSGQSGTWELVETITNVGNGPRDGCSYSLAGRQVVVVANGDLTGQGNGNNNVSPPAVASNIINPWPTN